ncbi:MAG: nicotinamide riboside transporter PnuC [Bacteroidia bacterium]|nr:nicotinamide mononucleotide transporter [Bacteroidia bacterium]MCZ2278408.1 nicotinamide riboside transporter PnuC [Bacteroidia bacterium]
MSAPEVLEWVGFIFGISGVWLTIRKNIWCFPVGMINVLITAYLVFDKNLFADVIQQIVYFFLLAAGWYMWSRKGNNEVVIRVSTLKTKDYYFLILLFISGSMMMGWFFKNYSTASLPYADSTATVICFIAQWLIARKKIENWILWMIANPSYIIIYLIKGLPLYAILSFIYFIMAIIGYRQWFTAYRNQ